MITKKFKNMLSAIQWCEDRSLTIDLGITNSYEGGVLYNNVERSHPILYDNVKFGDIIELTYPNRVEIKITKALY